jgi:hypothetical protein
VALPALVGRDPGPNLPWWVVTHMLRVPALELRDPVLHLVLMVPHDSTVHGLTLLYKIRPNGWPAASMKAASEFLRTNLTPSVIQ